MGGFILTQQQTAMYSNAPSTEALENAEATLSNPRLLQIETTYQIRRPALVRFLVRLGLDSVEADDVTQEAFLRAVDSSQNGKAPHNLFQWLMVSARTSRSTAFAMRNTRCWPRLSFGREGNQNCWTEYGRGDTKSDTNFAVGRVPCR